MSLFKKKQPEPTQREVLETFEKRLSNTETLSDPGCSYLELTAIERDVIKLISENYYSDPKRINKNIKESAQIVCAFAAFGTGIFFLAPPLGIFIGAVGAGLGSICGGANAALLLKNKRVARKSGLEYLPALKSLLEKVASKKEAIIQNHLLDLRSSERFKEICASFPDIASAFALAAAETGLDIPRTVQLNKPSTPPKP